MAIDVVGMINTMQSTAAALGLFASVNGHEPKSAPALGGALTYGFWFSKMYPVQSSGLNSTSIRVEFAGRIYRSDFTEPADLIDIEIMKAADALMALYLADFDLGGTARHIDVYGQHGESLAVTGGYLEQDKKIYRIADVFLPVIVNDAWALTP